MQQRTAQLVPAGAPAPPASPARWVGGWPWQLDFKAKAAFDVAYATVLSEGQQLLETMSCSLCWCEDYLQGATATVLVVGP
jgi:hypothetical protein